MDTAMPIIQPFELPHPAVDAAWSPSGPNRQEEILSGMAHDLRTPVFALLGYLDLIDRQLQHLGEPKAREYVRHARDAGWRCN